MFKSFHILFCLIALVIMPLMHAAAMPQGSLLRLWLKSIVACMLSSEPHDPKIRQIWKDIEQERRDFYYIPTINAVVPRVLGGTLSLEIKEKQLDFSIKESVYRKCGEYSLKNGPVSLAYPNASNRIEKEVVGDSILYILRYPRGGATYAIKSVQFPHIAVFRTDKNNQKMKVNLEPAMFYYYESKYKKQADEGNKK